MEPDRAAIPIEVVVDSPTSDSSHTLPRQDNESVVKNENASGQDAANDYPTGLKLASILAGVTMVYYLVFLDLAIISTATPAITTEFDALIDIGWYAGAYQLASAALQPLSGRIYTYFSLKWTFLAFFFVFELGSAICGAAQSSAMFIIGRAIAGLGSSGLFTGCFTTIANCVPRERRPLFQAINIGIGQLGLACGPVVGGAFTTGVSWRWCFYINLPIGAVVALCLVFNKVPEASVKPPWRHVLGTAVKSLDLVGFALVSPAAIMLLLALEYGGNQYAWDSSVVVGLLCGAAAVFALFLFWEHREGDGAMIPFAFLRSPVVRSASLTQFFALGGILIGDFYLAIFFQVVHNDSPLMSGVHLLPVTLGLVIFTLVTGGLVQVTGYYLPWILAGSAIATVSYGLMSLLSPTTTFGQWFGYLCLYGIGSGLGNSGAYIAVQSLVPLKQIPTAIAIVIFAQNVGAAVWVVVANAIFNNSLRKELSQRAALIGPSPEVIIEAGARNIRAAGLTPSQLAAVLVAYGKAIDRTMYLGIAVFGSVMLVAWEMGFENLKEVKRQKELKNDSTSEEGTDASSDVKPVEQRCTSKNALAILARMAELRRELFENDRVQKLNRNAGYKLVASLASYADEYKGVEEVILDSATREAVANVRLNKISKGGNFEVDPNLIDNFGQPALFTMNANDESDLRKEVFANHGFREELGNDYESSIFGLCPTVKELEDFWERGGEVETAAKHSSDDALLSSMLRDTVQKDDEDHMEQAASEPSTDSFEVISERSKSQSPKPSSTSLLLQGNPALPSTLETLFLLPDGSGSSSSYASIPRVNPSIAIVGLNCPYMKIPEQYNTGIEEVSAMYIHEIRRRQPHGPYALGGWSVGGIFAYHVAQQLTAEGDTVSDLILIDCPVARGLDHLPHRYYEYCDKVGLLGEGQMASVVLLHHG